MITERSCSNQPKRKTARIVEKTTNPGCFKKVFECSSCLSVCRICVKAHAILEVFMHEWLHKVKPDGNGVYDIAAALERIDGIHSNLDQIIKRRLYVPAAVMLVKGLFL